MSIGPSRRLRKFKKSWIVVPFLCGAIFVFHRPLLLLGCKLALHSYLPSASYEKIEWEKDQIVLSELQMEKEGVHLKIDRIEMELFAEEFCFQPKVRLIQPEVIFSSLDAEPKAPLLFLYRNRFFCPQWEVQRGEMELPSSSRLHYSLLPGENKEEMGTITLSYSSDPSVAPFFLCHLQRDNELLNVWFDLQPQDLSQLLPITALIVPEVRREWETARGAVDVRGQLVIDPHLKLIRLEFTGSAKEIALESPSIGINLACQECTGTFSYPSSEEGLFFWDKLSACFLVKEANCSLGSALVPYPFGIDHLNGELQLEPLEEPQLVMHGLLTKKDQQLGVTFLGKGSLQEDDTFWSVIECQCESLSGKQMQGVLSLCRHERDRDVLQLKIDHADSEHLDFFRFFADLPGSFQQGSVSGSVTWLFQKGVCLKTSVDHCLMENFQIAFPENQITSFIQKAEGECVLVQDLSDHWKWEDVKLTWSGVDYSSATAHFSEAKGEIGMENGKLLPSSIEAKWGDLKTEALFSLKEEMPVAHFRIFGDAKEVVKENPKPYPISIEGDLQLDENSLKADVIADLVGDQWTAEFCFENFLQSFSLHPFVLPKWKEGKVQSSKITANSYTPFISHFFPDIHCDGSFSCQALLSPSEIQLHLGGEEILLQSKNFEMQLPQLKGNIAHFTYDLERGEWRGTLPLFDAKLYSHDLRLPFEGIEADVMIDGYLVQVPSLYATCEGLKVKGALDATFFEDQPISLQFSTSHIGGSVQDLLKAARNIPEFSEWNFPVEGNFLSGEEGLVFTASFGASSTESRWYFKGDLQELSFSLNPLVQITHAHTALSFDSDSRRLVLEDTAGEWRLKNGSLLTVCLEECALSWPGMPEPPQCTFTAVVTDEKKEEVARLKGTASQESGSGWNVVFEEESTHFLNSALNITSLKLDEHFKPSSFAMCSVLDAAKWPIYSPFLQEIAGVQPFPSFAMEGTVLAQFASENVTRGFTFDLQSSDLKVQGHSWGSFLVAGRKAQETWFIEKMQGEEWFLNTAVTRAAEDWVIPYFKGHYKGFEVKGSAELSTLQKNCTVQLDALQSDFASLREIDLFKNLSLPKGKVVTKGLLLADYSKDLNVQAEIDLSLDVEESLQMTMRSRTPLQFHFSKAQGLQCKGIDFECQQSAKPVLYCRAESLEKQEGEELFLKDLNISVQPAFFRHLADRKILPAFASRITFEDTLQISGDLTFTESGPVYLGTLPSGIYGIDTHYIACETLQLRYENEQMLLKAKTLVQENPLYFSVQMNLAKEPLGVIRLFDGLSQEGLMLFFSTPNGALSWDRLQGSCYGVSCQLEKHPKRNLSGASVLTGEIAIDGTALTPLLPTSFQTLQVGAGYKWQGDLTLWQNNPQQFQLSGLLSGENFELLGIRLEHFESNIEASADRIYLSNLRIEDESGAMGIKRIDLKKEADWNLFIPQIIVREMWPSLLKRVDGTAAPLRPFAIKNLLIKDLHGNLNDLSSLEASGHLAFINQWKKESSIFDIPLSLFKDIGLDPAMLTPVQGEVDLEWRGDKCYLVTLKNAFSEGNRSEFYLAPTKELSYIDLSGKVHINLRINQDVLLKLAEPFTLTVRGSLEKLRYGIQF